MVFFTGTSSVQTTGGCCSRGACEEPPSVVTSDQTFFDPGTSTSGLSSGVNVGVTGSSLVQTTGGCCSCGGCEEPPSVVTSDQTFFDPRTSTSGLSSGVTVGGTGFSLVQTTGKAAQRVDLPEVAVII